MAWIARDLSEDLYVYDSKPVRDDEFYGWIIPDAFRYEIFDFNRVELPSDADEKLIGRHITWEDNPVELK
jgi:hypothetical protein